jgi:hypothetical protein
VNVPPPAPEVVAVQPVLEAEVHANVTACPKLMVIAAAGCEKLAVAAGAGAGAAAAGAL